MKIVVQSTIVMAALSTVTACGGSGNSGLQDDAVSMPTVSAACDTEYHNIIRGSYNGQIEFSSPVLVDVPQSCIWEVSLSIFTESDLNGLCQTGFDHQSELASGDADCIDLAATGVIDDPFGLDVDQPSLPLEAALSTTEQLDLFRIYPTGNIRNNGRWSYVIDGRGNASFDSVSNLIGYTGTLVMFSDQPFQQDDNSITVDVQGDVDE